MDRFFLSCRVEDRIRTRRKTYVRMPHARRVHCFSFARETRVLVRFRSPSLDATEILPSRTSSSQKDHPAPTPAFVVSNSQKRRKEETHSHEQRMRLRANGVFVSILARKENLSFRTSFETRKPKLRTSFCSRRAHARCISFDGWERSW